MVIHGRKDELFTAEGRGGGLPEDRGGLYEKRAFLPTADLRYYDTPHEFNAREQKVALDWLKKWLKA